MDFRKILTLLAGVILAGDYIQAYPLTAAEEVTKPSGSQHGYGYVVDYYAHPKYQFDYYVHDPHTGDVKKQWESRDGDVVKGSYTINDPDGTIRTVEYTADKHTGFNAVVRRHGKSYHPKTVISHEKAYDGGHTEQAADVDQGVHTEAIAEGVTSEKANYGSDVVQYEHQPTVTFQEAPLQSSSHQTVIRHIVSQPITWYHPQQQVAANQATELQAEPPQQAEPHQAAHYQPEEETKYEPTAEVNKINEVAHQTEEVEHAEEVSETNVENTQHTNAEQIQPDDDNGYYTSMSFDSQRYPTGKKTTSTK